MLPVLPVLVDVSAANEVFRQLSGDVRILGVLRVSDWSDLGSSDPGQQVVEVDCDTPTDHLAKGLRAAMGERMVFIYDRSKVISAVTYHSSP